MNEKKSQVQGPKSKVEDRANDPLTPDIGPNTLDALKAQQSTLDSRNRPVECLGMTFESDETRRAYFLDKLRERLRDPEFRKIEGFPIGSDEDILALSDPPYYTACPNPWIADFIRFWEAEKSAVRSAQPEVRKDADPAHHAPRTPHSSYHREPFAADVSEGKNDPIYKAHSYHTKVPHLAIVPSILHYTEPGDVVLDGFCGSGMTGVAAQWCGVAPNAYRMALEMAWKKDGHAAPKWGPRRAVLNDLSPAATFIGANYNIPFDVDAFAKAGKQLLKELEQEIGWMYETLHSDGKTIARIDYTVWSEVLACPSCAGEIVFTDAALDEETKAIADLLACPHCSAQAKKEQMDLQFETFIDPTTGQPDKRPKRVPALIAYKLGRTAYTKKPDKDDLERITKIAALPLPKDLPTDRFPDMQMTRVGRMKTTNSAAIHFMFLPRAAQAMALLWRKAKATPNPRARNILLFMVEQAIWGLSILARYTPTHFSQVNQYLSGVYYVASQQAECSPWYILDGKLDRLAKAFREYKTRAGNAAINTGTAAHLPLSDNAIDYIFTDPPFGENIYYSDLNFLVESWHGVKTDPNPEAIVDRVRQKGIPEYQHLMYSCFAEYFRVLKPGRWMTVVFSNSKAAVWNAIQVALQQAGFVVAEVTALDKVQGSFQQVMSPNTVKQDLIISVYKPNGGLEERFTKSGATIKSAWDFVQTHLRQLSVTKVKNGELEFIIERDPRRIYDRMVAWFVRHDAPVPLSNDEFQISIRSRFPERDGMVFLPEQVTEYDKKRLTVREVLQLQLFVTDEASAIQWLKQQITKKPQTFQDLHPQFLKEIGGWQKHEKPLELSELLEQNFLRYDGKGPIPAQIVSWMRRSAHLRPEIEAEFQTQGIVPEENLSLSTQSSSLITCSKDRWYVPDPNKAGDLEKLRERSLLKEFEDYRTSSQKRLKVFRLEAVRAGFKKAWQERDYATIITVACKVPENVLQEDPKLLMWYDQAITRTEGV